MVQAIANAKDILQMQKSLGQDTLILIQSFRTTTLTPQTPPQTLTTEIRECSLAAARIIHDFRSELGKTYIFISQYLRILEVHGSERRV